MRYTQKDICRAFDITRDTLRHYERLGIIQPEVAENGYRLYDDWQINLIWDCKHYQAMGFSLAQIREIMHRNTLGQTRGLIGERLGELERELAYRQMALDAMRLHQRLLRGAEERMGVFVVRELPEAVFVPRREVHDLLLDEKLSEAGHFVNENQAVCLPPCAYFPSHEGDRYYWGFAMYGDWYRELGGPEAGTVSMPEERVLTTCVDAGERWGFGRALFEGLLAEARRRGETPAGPIYGFLLARTHDERGGYHRFVEACLPLA